VRPALADFQIVVHRVGDTLINTVTDWRSYLLDNLNPTFPSWMR